ncbi:MAG: hypothetical protein WD065_17170 [Planctomycetaceae bacterium]
MFWGQPFCESCGFRGPEFMWLHHHYMDYDALVQDLHTLEFRLIRIPDDDVFYKRAERTDDERKALIEDYVETILSREMRPTEKYIAGEEILKWWREPDGLTELQCPQCRQRLKWDTTGIS